MKFCKKNNIDKRKVKSIGKKAAFVLGATVGLGLSFVGGVEFAKVKIGNGLIRQSDENNEVFLETLLMEREDYKLKKEAEAP